MMQSRGMMALRWAVFAFAAFVMNFPVISTLVTSLKSEAEIASYPGFWVEAPTLENYREIFRMSDRFDITHYLTNSLVMSLIGAGLSLLLAFPAAYAMVRFEIGNKWLMPTIVNLRAIPLIIFAIPIYLMYQQVDLLDTRLGMGLIQCLVNLPLVLVLLATSIAELPEEIEEAARVDGAGTFRIFWSIALPLAKPALATVAIFYVIFVWNDFLYPLLYLQSEELATIPIGLVAFKGQYSVDWGVQTAALTIATIVPVAFYLMFQSWFIKGVTAGSLKG